MNQTNKAAKAIFGFNSMLVILLATCLAMAVTTSAINGLGMGLATTFVLCMSNMFISMVKDWVPDKVRIPAFMVIIACFVTIADLGMQAWAPSMSSRLGIFILLVIINCLVLGKAGNFASQDSIIFSFIKGLTIGLGFTLALVIIGFIREILGTGSAFGQKFIAEEADGILVFLLAPGALIIIGFLAAIVKTINKK